MSIPSAGATAFDLAGALRGARVIPVLSIERLADAVPLAEALAKGGVAVIEVTLRTPVALDAMRAIVAAVPAVAVAAGTVLSHQDLEHSRAAGAALAFSPGATPELLETRERPPLPLVPGVATPSEAMAARARGYRLLKFFPAEAAGGVAALKAMAGPLPDLVFCPSGGLDADNFASYLALPNVVAVGGSWLAPEAAVRAGAWSDITRLARRAFDAAP